MATEAGIAESISHTQRDVEVSYLTATVQLETTKDIINSTFGTSESGNFLEPFSAPKVANENVSSMEHYQADEPIESEREKPENEKQLQKGEQLETSEERRREENEQTEEKITTAEQDNKSHGILEAIESSPEVAKTEETGIEIDREEAAENKIAVEHHIGVISNQQASTEESQHSIEKEIKGSEEDEKQETVEDKSTSLSGKEVLNVDNTSSTTDAEEIGQERSFTGVLNKEAEKSFDLADEEKVPEAIGSSKETEIEKDDKGKITDNSFANASIPNVAASQETQDDEEETFKNRDTATDKLEKASEQEATIEEEAPIAACKVIIQDAIESIEQEKDGAPEQEKDGAPEILNIAKESTLDVTNQSDFLVKASLTSVTSSGNINNDEISEEKFDASSIMHEEGIQLKDERLDVTEAEVGEASDMEESTVVVAEDITSSKLIQAEDDKELESTEHDGRIEQPILVQQNEPENKKLELNAIAEQQEIAASKDDAITTTCIEEESNGPEITGKDVTEEQEDENDAGKLKEEESSRKINKEGNINELSPEDIQDVSTETFEVDKYEAEMSKEEIVEESETVGAGESISCEASEHVERSADVSSVKQEVREEEAEDLVSTKASIEEKRVDMFAAELANDDEHDIVEAIEKTVKVESKGEEDSEKALQKDEPEETPVTEKKEENTENLDNVDSTRKEVLETTVAGQETEEQISEEFTNKRPTEENSKEHKEFTALEVAPLSTKTGDHNLEEQTISELSSSFAIEETVEDSSKGDENNAIDSKEEKENKNSEFKKQDVATELTVEKEPGDSTEPDKDNYATETTEHLEEEILAEESKETFDQNSLVASETNEKVVEEEIQDKGVTINNSDSVPDTIVREEKETKPDNKDQVIYSDIALEEKELTSNVDSEVQKKQKSSTEESGEEIPASESVEQIDKPPTPRIENEEKRANSETILDDVPEDSLQDSSIVPSIKNEALTIEASDLSEETPARDETHHESAKTPSAKPKEEELQLIDEDESAEPYDVSKLETYDIVKETENELVQKQRDQELHISAEQINDINSSESGDVGTLKMEEATDFAYGNEVSSSEILKDEKLSIEVSTKNAVDTCIDSEKAIQEYKDSDNNSEGSLKSEVDTAVELEANTNKNDELPTKEALEISIEGQETTETHSIKDYSPEFANEEQLEEGTYDDKVIVGVDTTSANTTIRKQELEEQDISEISSSLLQEETIKEILMDDKNAVTNLEEERKTTDLDSKEQLEGTDLRVETKFETLEENIEPNKDLYATRHEEAPEKETNAEEDKKVLSQDSSIISDVSEKVIEEESEEKEPAVYNSKSVSDGIVIDESGLKGELEDKEQVNSFTIEAEEKGSASSATFDVKPEESSSSEEIREEILTTENDHGDKIEDKVKESIDTRTEEEEKITTNETPAGTVTEETALKHGEPEDEKQVKSYTVAPEEKDSASSSTYDVNLEENSSTEEKREEILTGANDYGETREDKVEESIGTQTEEEEKIASNETPAGTVSEETALKHDEPEDEEQVKSYTIAPEEKDSASSATFDVKPEENSSIEEIIEEILTASNGQGEKLEAKVEEIIDTQIEEEENKASNETSTGTVSEETWLKKGELEDKGQMKSCTIAPDDSASSATFDVKPEENSSTEQNSEEILTAAYHGGEKTEEKVKENNDAETEEEKKITTSETALHGIPGDDHLTTEAAERTDEVTNLEEETKLEILEDSAGPNKVPYATITKEALGGEKLSEESNSSSVVEVSEKVIEDVIQDKAPVVSNSSSDPTGIPIEETGLKEAELENNEQVRNSNTEPDGKGLASSPDIEIKQEENSNTEQNGEKEISAIAESGEKIGHALEETRETDSVEDYSPESSNKEQHEENTKEDKVLVGIQTAPLSTSIEEQELGEQEVSETSSSFPGGEKAQEILKDDKNALLNLKEERKDTELDSKEQLDVTLEKNIELYKDLDTMRTIEATEAETHAEECNTILVPDSSFVSEITKPEKEIGEEIKEIEPTVYNSNSVSAGTVSEEIDLKKGEPEEKDQVKSYTPDPEKKGSAPEDKENGEEILAAANVHGKKIEDKEEESIDTQIEEKKNDTSETSPRDIPEADLLINEAEERLDDTPAGDEVTDLTEEIKHDTLEDSERSNKELYAAITTEALEEEKIAEQNNKILVQSSSLVAEVSEKIIEEKFQDKETVSTGTVIEETDMREAEPENKEHIQNSDIAPEVKAPTSNVDVEIPEEKNSILEKIGEEEIPVVAGESGEEIGHAEKNFEASISDAEVVKTATELKAENTETNEIQTEENLESLYPGQMLAYTSESASQYKIEETLPLTKEIHTEPVPIEQQEVAQNFHGETEIKVETEPRLIVEDQISEIESTSETIKAVILTEVTEEIEIADKSENIEEQVIERESNLKEFHPVSIGEEKDSGLVLGENLKEPDSKETMPPNDSQTEEDTSNKGESSVTEAPDKEKIQDEEITEPMDVCVAVAEERKYEEEIKGDKAIVAEATAVTNLADAQLVNETVNTFETASEERNLDELKYEPSVLRDDSLNLEKSSSNLVSQHLNLDDRDTERENATVENLDEVQETKKASDVEDIDETRPAPTVEKLETDEIEEEIKESSKIVSTSEGVNDQALSTGISEEELRVQPSTFFAEEQEHETKTAVKEFEKESSQEVDKQGHDNIEDSSAAQKEEHKELKVSELDVEKLVADEIEDIKNAPEKEITKEVEKQDNKNIEDSSITNLQKEDHKEHKVSELDVEKLVTDETDEDIKNAPDKESTKEVEKQGNENTEDSSAINLQKQEHEELKVSELEVEKLVTDETEEDIENAPEKEGTDEVEKQDNESIEDSSATLLQQEEHKELKVSELAVEKMGTNETEEDIEIAPETVSKSHSQLIEAVSKDEIITDQTLPAKITSREQFRVPSSTFLPKEQEAFTQKEEPKEVKVSEVVVEISGAAKTEEQIEDASATVTNSNSEEFEKATKGKTVTGQTHPEEISKEQLLVSSSTLLRKEHEDETATTTKKVEEENKKEVEIQANENTIDNSSPKTAEEYIFVEKEEPGELKVSEPTAQILGENDTEEIVIESKTVSERGSSNIEVLKKDETITDQALTAGLSPEQLQLPALSALLPKDKEHEITTTVEKTEEEIAGLGSPLKSEKTTETRGEIIETSNLNIDSSEISSDFVSEKVQNDGVLTETEDTEVGKSHSEIVKTDLETEESRSDMTIEANKTVKNEILDEEIKKDKEVTNESQPISLHEANAEKSHQEIDSETKEHPGDKTDGTEIQQRELSEADVKEGTDGNTEKLIISEATSVKDHEPLSIEDRTIEDESPAEAEEKNVKEEALNLETENQKDEVNFENRTAEFTSKREKETMEIPQEESGLGLTEAEKITRDIKQAEKSSHTTSEKQTPREEDLDENSKTTRFTAAEKDVELPPMVPDPTEETTQRIEPKQTEPQNDASLDTEIEEVERGTEEEMGESGGRTAENAASSAGKLKLSELMQSSTKEAKQRVIEEREVKSSKEAEEEYQGEAEKDEEEEEEEHRGSSEPESDAPVIVEASRDIIDVKVGHKKSHNILSGVGSKVKHSISKVKKVITGKSSHSKQSNKKPDDPSS